MTALLRRLCCWFVLAALPWVAVAQSPAVLPPGVRAEAMVEGVQAYRLPNGLQVLLVPDDSKPTTTVNMTYHVGSRHENYGETGMAHLLEHLLFKGTATMSNLLGEFVKRGLRANGTTSYDRTNYFASFSSNDETLRWYIGWQADAMVNSRIARADLDTEMTVVRNEMEAGENNPGRVLLQQTLAAMYQWHNYGKSTIGARADVENVDIARLQAFYRRHYQPDNATLIVAGKFEVARTLGWIAEAFAPIPRPTRTLEPTYTVDAPQDGERAVTVRRVGGAPLVYVGYHTPPGSHPDYAAFHVLAQVLGDSPSGRLHKRLVQQQLASATFAFPWSLAEPGPLFLGAQLGPGQDPARARDEILAAVDALAREPVTAEELERARTQWLKAWELGFTDPERVGVELSDAIALGDWRLYFLERDRMRSLRLEEVNRVAAQWLVRDNRTVGLYLPTEQPQRAPAPALADVAAMVKDYRGDPAAARAEAFDPTPANLDARTRLSTLASGLKVGLLAKGTRGGVVQARLRLRYGDAESLRGQDTVAGFAAGLLDKGGAGLTRQQIADRLDQLRAQVRFDGSGQTLSVSITTTRDHLPAVIDLVARLLREPAYPADTLEELRRQALTAIERTREEPDDRIENLLDRHGNPYPRGDLRHVPTFDEMVADVNAVTREQVVAFQQRFYSASNGEFAAAGDFDPAAVLAALEAGFGRWGQPAAGAQPYVRVPRPLVIPPAERFVVRTPDKQNANLRIALPMPIGEADADYPALMMANHLLGSSGNSRLWARLREREGLSYDVRSGIEWNPYEPNSRWVASAIFAPQNQARVEAAVREEIDRALKDGFTQAELDNARRGLLEFRRLGRAQDAGIASAIAQNLHLNRRFAVSQRVDEALAALTLEQVNAALRRYVDPARWSVAWGGDFKP